MMQSKLPHEQYPAMKEMVSNIRKEIEVLAMEGVRPKVLYLTPEGADKILVHFKTICSNYNLASVDTLCIAGVDLEVKLAGGGIFSDRNKEYYLYPSNNE